MEHLLQKKEISEFLTRQYIDKFLTGTFFSEDTPITNALHTHFNLPKLGAHLISPRIGYKHHGIYVGDKKVIHYSGLADGLHSGPVEEVCLNTFQQNKKIEIKLHPHCTFSPEKIVQRAKSRLSESKYNLISNNCEHFVHWCIYNVNESKQISTSKKIIAVMSKVLKGTTKKAPNIAIPLALHDTTKYIRSYIDGNINKEKLIEEISYTAVTTTSTFYMAGLGQIAIPIPVFGAFVGAGVGYFVGNMLHQSGLIALGDSRIVREAKERRQVIEKLCQSLIPEIQKSRKNLTLHINKHFSERKEEFSQSFNILDESLNKWDSDNFVAALERINKQFGASLQFKTFNEFDNFMKSDKPLKF